jgi:hypothetical protein
MLDKSGIVRLVRARVRALLPKQWRSEPGRQVRETVDEISEFAKKNVRLAEKLEALPDVLWNTAQVKSSEALVNAADEEQKRIASELARQILPDKVRQEKATADRMEAEARLAQIKEIQERLAFLDKLRTLGVVPVWDSNGTMTFLRAAVDFDWDEISRQMMKADALQFTGQNLVMDGRLDAAGDDKSVHVKQIVSYPPPTGLRGKRVDITLGDLSSGPKETDQ